MGVALAINFIACGRFGVFLCIALKLTAEVDVVVAITPMRIFSLSPPITSSPQSTLSPPTTSSPEGPTTVKLSRLEQIEAPAGHKKSRGNSLLC